MSCRAELPIYRKSSLKPSTQGNIIYSLIFTQKRIKKWIERAYNKARLRNHLKSYKNMG